MSNKDYKAIYGRTGLRKSPYDKRDYKFKNLNIYGAVKIPDNYESPDFPFVYDQGSSSMCCACAYSAVRYLQESGEDGSGLTEPFSPAFTYGNRDASENFEGMYLRSCCKRGRFGSLLLRDLEGFYSVSKAVALVNFKKQEFFKKAEPFRIENFYVCHSRRETQTAIYTTKGVIIGIPVFECLYNTGKDGYVKYDPSKDIDNAGGHAVALTGWKVDEKGNFYWRMLNSWGKEWADGGYCWLPESYPWMEDAYALVDDKTNKAFEQYLKENYPSKSTTPA